MLARAAPDKGEFESVFVASFLIVEYRLDHRRIGENLRAEIGYSEACISIRCVTYSVGEAELRGRCMVARESGLESGFRAFGHHRG